MMEYENTDILVLLFRSAMTNIFQFTGNPEGRYGDRFSHPGRSNGLAQDVGRDDGGGGEEEIDEFGRSTKVREEIQKQPKTFWPPPFEDSGSAFVLDNRSGMFYEAESDFFFDPKSKMYFGNKQRAYYTYDAELKRFQKVENINEAPVPSSEATTTDLVPIMDGSAFKGADSQRAISIKLKTKRLPSKTTKISGNSLEHENVATKHAVDIEKWSIRQSERRVETGVVYHRTEKIIKTVHGNPVCLLCRRKFATVEKLRRHESESELHQRNLLSSKTMPTVTDGSSVAYVDRARQRRELHDDADAILAAPLPLDNGISAERPMDAVHASDEKSTPSTTNIGESMLKKLGWKPGDNQGESKLRRDWSRIEAMAANGRSSGSRSGSGLGS
jgi:RNA-binding protein 5/10